MKKVLILATLILFAATGAAFAAGAPLATDTASTTTGMSIYGGVNAADAARDGAVLLGRMSKGVSFKGGYDAAAGQGFSAATKHTSGTKVYGSAHNSTAIYFMDVGESGAIPSLSEGDNGDFTAGWTAM